MCVPGSHKVPYPENGYKKGKYPEGAIQVLAEAGDAVIFPWRCGTGSVRIRLNAFAKASRSVMDRCGLVLMITTSFLRTYSHG